MENPRSAGVNISEIKHSNAKNPCLYIANIDEFGSGIRQQFMFGDTGGYHPTIIPLKKSLNHH